MTTRGKERLFSIDSQPGPAKTDFAPNVVHSTVDWLVVSFLEIEAPTPELRFTETDQTDPAGRFRWQGTDGSYYLYKALTANWATQEAVFAHDISNKVTYLYGTTATDWNLALLGGAYLDDGGSIYIGNGGGVKLSSGNGAGAESLRLQILGNATTPDMDFTLCRPDFNGLNLVGVGTLRGQGSQALYLRGWRETTDAVGQRVILDVLDPATDTVYPVAQAVPHAGTPFWTQIAPDHVPTTSELDAGHITFGYTAATDTLNAYVNEGGVIRALAIGVMV